MAFGKNFAKRLRNYRRSGRMFADSFGPDVEGRRRVEEFDALYKRYAALRLAAANRRDGSYGKLLDITSAEYGRIDELRAAVALADPK